MLTAVAFQLLIIAILIAAKWQRLVLVRRLGTLWLLLAIPLAIVLLHDYHERVVSNRTEALFVVLTLLCLWLLVRRLKAGKHDWLTRVFFGLFGVFLFYSVNYRVLSIRLSDKALTLTFGLFTWRVPLENVETARLDELPLLMRFGGAMMLIRASGWAASAALA